MQWKDRIGRRLKLQDVHILLAAVETGSMAKAAEHLAISQPVVSRAVASLEQTLGVRLLDRSRSGIAPTLYGRALLAHGPSSSGASTPSSRWPIPAPVNCASGARSQWPRGCWAPSSRSFRRNIRGSPFT